MASLKLHKNHFGSISSQPSTVAEDGQAGRLGNKDQMLDDLGMRGLGELGFPGVKMDR